MGPEVSWVFGSFSLACCTEGLTRETCREDSNVSSQFLIGKCFEVRVDNSWTQGSLFNLLSQVEGGEGFDLHINPTMRFADSCEFDSSADSVIACTEVQVDFGIIHNLLSPKKAPWVRG